MNIPPLLKIPTNLLSKFPARSIPHLNINRVVSVDSTKVKINTPNLNNDKIIPVKYKYISIDSILNLNLDDSIDFIHGFLTNTEFSARQCLVHNLKSLSSDLIHDKRLKGKDISAINYRILSFDDHLNFTHLAKLIFAITSSDRRLWSLVPHLTKLFLEKDCDLSELKSSKNYLYSQFVVLTSLLVFKRNSLNLNVKLIGKGGSRVKLGDEPCMLENFPEIEYKVLKNIELILSRGELGLNNEEPLLFLKIVSLVSHANDNVVKSLNSHVEIDNMSLGQMCSYLHTLSLLPVSDILNFIDLSKSTLERITESVKSGIELPKSSIPELYHYFYLTGDLEHELFDIMSDEIVRRRLEFECAKDFYRVTFPLSISRRISSPELSKWLLNQLAMRCDTYMSDLSNFLFVLMSVASSVKIDYSKPKRDENLKTMDIETDIYEKALMYLNESTRGAYFPSERAALLYLFEKTMELLEECDEDQFVQLTQALTHKLVKMNTSMKLRLLKECKKRVNTVRVGGIPHILQFVVWMYGNKNPDLVAALTMYMERILSDVATYNVGDHALLQTSTLHTDSFLTDIKSLANVLYIMDWSGVHSADLAREVYNLVSSDNYKMISGAELRDLSHIVHYIALSNTDLKNLDPLYIVIREALRKDDEVQARDLIMIIESMIINAQHTRHKQLLKVIEEKAMVLPGPASTIETLSNSLSRLTDVKYTLKDNGSSNYILQLNA
ncbi:conserved hypothetical protein [Theileria orientalis strain Shintoku]|uniref:Uncharacterized protein n=1 Tax=Theileria orientalis strain Shintoku TaxID=869250 RepID=J4C7N3_THEOR|nr:conserved hypothetical protein [Theileria orientalis strain Shintoku]PVC54801.1 hypothetical protein MACL_00003535 [Theileria orientalis]BAM39338.1 conserved hypothetical protein [Theileria orientalis strain Shintoku]|eukprot:XP_009689639.1 conserved hypothetical protein [Theileria orientalis strain Shintoku]